MKKIALWITLMLSALGGVKLFATASEAFYLEHLKLIWWGCGLLGIFLIVAQTNFTKWPSFNRELRRLSYHIFKTKTICWILFLQVLAQLFVIQFINTYDAKAVLLIFGIDLLIIVFLMISDRIQVHEPKKMIFHVVPKMYLYSNNCIRYIPDPETFALLGLDWTAAVDKTEDQLQGYLQKPPITSILAMQLLTFRAATYGIVNDKLKHIPNYKTLLHILALRPTANNTPIMANSISEYEIDRPFVSI